MRDEPTAKEHKDIAFKYALASGAKLSLSTAFAGFSAFFPTLPGRVLAYAGVTGLLMTDVIPTLRSKLLSEADEDNTIIYIINILKKVASAVEGFAIVGVYTDLTLQALGKTDDASRMTNVLFPAFAAILGAKGILGLLTEIEKMVRNGVNFENMTTAIVGAGGTLTQAGMIVAFLKQLIEVKPSSGINSAITLGQGIISAGFGFWHYYKSTKTEDTDYFTINASN